MEPNEAKKLGGKKYFKEHNYKIRDDWNDKRLEIMRECTEAYYNENKDMMKRLVETGDKKLIHKGFRIDGFWGVNKKEQNNHHGKILMSLRDKFSKINDKEDDKENEVVDEEELEDEDKEILIYDGLKYVHYFEDDVVMDEDENEDVGTWDGENIVWKDDKTYKRHLKEMRKMKKEEDSVKEDDEDEEAGEEEEEDEEEGGEEEEEEEEEETNDDSASEIGLGDDVSFSSESDEDSEEDLEDLEEDEDSNVQALKSLIKRVNKRVGGNREDLYKYDGGNNIRYDKNSYCGGWGMRFVK